jgi:hypothetical protein
MAAARRVPEVGEEALADLVVGILHENNGNMCACRAGQNLYNLDPAYKPLLKRIGGIKGLCSRHSERLQYVGNDGGGVVRLGSGEIYVSPKQQIREEHQVPLLPAIVEGGAGLDPELDRPSGAATDAPAANQNIGAQDTPAHTPVAWAGGGGAGGEGVAAGARGGLGEILPEGHTGFSWSATTYRVPLSHTQFSWYGKGAVSQPSSSWANSAQNLGGADANGEQQQHHAQQHQISSAADALAPLPPPAVGELWHMARLAWGSYRTWRDSQHTGETNAEKRARYLLLFPEGVSVHADTEGDGVHASARLKDAAVEVAAQLEGSAVHKEMLQSLELAGTVGLTTKQLMDGKGMNHVFAQALKTHGPLKKGLSPASVFAHLSGIKSEKLKQGGRKYFYCGIHKGQRNTHEVRKQSQYTTDHQNTHEVRKQSQYTTDHHAPNDEGARGILPHNNVEHDAVPAIQQIDMMQQRGDGQAWTPTPDLLGPGVEQLQLQAFVMQTQFAMQKRQQQMTGGGDAPAAGTQTSVPNPAASVEPMPANTAASIKALRDVARLFRGRVWPNTKAQVKSAIASLYREHPAWLWEWIPRESKLDNCNEEKQIKNMSKIFKQQWDRLGVLSMTKKNYTWNKKRIEHLLEKHRTQMEGDGGHPEEAARPVATMYRLATGENVELVQSVQRLQQLLSSDTALRGDSDSVVALDCEGVPESLHLIQLATRERVVVLDGIKLGQKEMCESLAPLLTSKQTVKLLHDLHKDAAAFAIIGGVEMSNCLDSQLAMELISQKLHMGFNEMLKQLGCTVHPSKREMKERMASDSSKTIFLQRPLPRNVIEYAAMDVILLRSAHERSYRLPCIYYSLTPNP